MLVDPETPASGLFLVLQGVLRVETPRETVERGPGQIVGEWEQLDGSEDVRVTAQTATSTTATATTTAHAAKSPVTA